MLKLAKWASSDLKDPLGLLVIVTLNLCFQAAGAGRAPLQLMGDRHVVT
jgi:hypothetical protein